jgi:hypothetical protein
MINRALFSIMLFACVYRKLDPGIMVMKSAEDGM